jgi:galactokinase
MTRREAAEAAFGRRFGTRPRLVVRAPGRVNLIGEHTDYNQGFVLPMAIDRSIWITLRARPDRRVVAASLDFDECVEFDLAEIRPGGPSWAEYLKGSAWSLKEEGFDLAGWEGVVTGDVPIGAGLASSAALEMATIQAFAAVSGIEWSPTRMALLGQRAENRWVGVNCGIMDQLVCAAGREGHALLIDCRTLEATPAPLPPGASVLVLDTSTRRGLVASAYNERRQSCEHAARALQVAALRDVSEPCLEQCAGLDELTRQRARHVVTENRRTLLAARAMRQGDAPTLGGLINESHASLRDDFEVSTPALDAMVECALREEGCYGARMTGAGFGGSALALVREERVVPFTDAVAARFRDKTGLTPRIDACRASAGTEVAWRE